MINIFKKINQQLFPNTFSKKASADSIKKYGGLFQDFEPELLDELLNCDLMEIPAGMETAFEGMDVNMIPIVLEGDMKVYKKDEAQKESTIYHIKPGESCIISITKGFRAEASPAKAIAVSNSKIYSVPRELSNEWLEKYAGWRRYVVELYNRRIEELISQHQQVTVQKDEITAKNGQIMESIRYARRIQQAVLPHEEDMKRLASKHFVFYRPKDIVSGDFYWTKRDKNRTYIAVADATGHGVPGAFMSMLGISLMTEISQMNLDNAAEFLNILRKKVKEALRQSDYDTATKDGMDVSFCMVDLHKNVVHYAGAYNPLYRFHDNELIEIKADKMPIGIHYHEKDSFTNHQFPLEDGDVFYMFSDGFIDQTGGEKNKKYMSKNFRKLLTEIHPKPISEQGKIIEKTFDQWKGKNEQVDDVLVFGVRIETI